MSAALPGFLRIVDRFAGNWRADRLWGASGNGCSAFLCTDAAGSSGSDGCYRWFKERRSSRDTYFKAGREVVSDEDYLVG